MSRLLESMQSGEEVAKDHLCGARMSIAADTEWFARESDELLVKLTKQEFAVSLEEIADLERRAEKRLPKEAVQSARRSCADLRLDAALCTRQPYDECERRYQDLLDSGVDAELQLIKATILVRAAGGEPRARQHLSSALNRAGSANVSTALQQAARELL